MQEANKILSIPTQTEMPQQDLARTFLTTTGITINEAEQEVRRYIEQLTKTDINNRRTQIRLELKKSNLKRAFRMAKKKEHSLSYFSTLDNNNQITHAKVIKSATRFFKEKQKIPDECMDRQFDTSPFPHD